MRLIIKDTSEAETEGVLENKDSSFVFLRIIGAIRVYPWNKIKEVFRVYKGSRMKVNIDTFKRGRE